MKIISAFLQWSLVRKIQALFGLVLLISFAQQPDDMFSLGFGLLFMAQAVFNLGCAGQACASPPGAAPGFRPKEEGGDEMVSYEEIKGNQ